MNLQFFALLLATTCSLFSSVEGFFLDGMNYTPGNAPNLHWTIVHDKPDHVETNTSCGFISGLNNSGIYSFRGIPYAVPPVSDLRWKSPIPIKPSTNTCWQGTFKAFQFGNQCTQLNMETDTVEGDENCLFLNVWTPTLDRNAKLPVMVFIHGGSLEGLNGSSEGFTPNEDVARDTNVVYVSMNYRLQAFGFMALDILSADSLTTNTSGNYGFMDQILALDWVKENIGNFGGNPDDVVLAGHSSGATSVFALLTSPFAEGLFQRALLMSASPILNKTASAAAQDNLKFLHNTQCTDLDCLRSRSAENITRSVPWSEYPFWDMMDQVDLPTRGRFDGALAVIDGFIIPEVPFDAWVNGKASDVPLMIGSAAQEVDFESKFFRHWNWTHYQEYVRTQLGTFSASLANMALQLYPVGEQDPEYQITTMITDIRVTCGTDLMATYAAVNTVSPVYRYVVTPLVRSEKRQAFDKAGSYAFHGIDLLAYLNTMNIFGESFATRNKPLQNNIRTEILSFVKTGKPASDNWIAYPYAMALLSDYSSVVMRNSASFGRKMDC